MLRKRTIRRHPRRMNQSESSKKSRVRTQKPMSNQTRKQSNQAIQILHRPPMTICRTGSENGKSKKRKPPNRTQSKAKSVQTTSQKQQKNQMRKKTVRILWHSRRTQMKSHAHENRAQKSPKPRPPIQRKNRSAHREKNRPESNSGLSREHGTDAITLLYVA